MNTALIAAAVLAVLIGIAHSVLGERYILLRLFRRDSLPELFGGVEFTKRTLRFAWHVTTLAWWGYAALLVVMARGATSLQSAALVVAATFLSTGAVALVASRGRHLSWIVFAAIGAIALCAAI